MLQWIILGSIGLVVIGGLASLVGFEMALVLLALLVAGSVLFITCLLPRFKWDFESRESKFLDEELTGKTEYSVAGFQKAVIGTERLYLRQKNFEGELYTLKDIHRAEIGYSAKDEMVHYEDEYGAAKMGAVAGVASWFGIGTIADLDSLGKDVLETRVIINLRLDMSNGEKLSFCVFNRIVKDADNLLTSIKSIGEFAKQLNTAISQVK